jgi:hypothetical protein
MSVGRGAVMQGTNRQVRRSALALALFAGTAAAVCVAWVVGFRAWADGRTPGDLATESRHDDPTLMVEWFVKGATVGTVYAVVTFAAICALTAAVLLARRLRRG